MAKNYENFCDTRLLQILQNRKPCLCEVGDSDIEISEEKATKGALTRLGSMNPANKN